MYKIIFLSLFWAGFAHMDCPVLHPTPTIFFGPFLTVVIWPKRRKQAHDPITAHWLMKRPSRLLRPSWWSFRNDWGDQTPRQLRVAEVTETDAVLQSWRR